MKKNLTAQQLFDFLSMLKDEYNYDLSNISVNYRNSSDSDLTLISYVYEDLYDAETNTNLKSILLTTKP